MKKIILILSLILITILNIEISYISKAPAVHVKEQPAFDNIQDKKAPITYFIKEYYQYPDYPAGCEIASLCMVLRAYGFNIDIEQIYQNYISRSDSEFITSYYGSIYNNGFAFPYAIATAANRYLIDNNSNLIATDISGCSWKQYLSYLENNTPIISWYTIDGKTPNWSKDKQGNYEFYRNEHCIVIYGINYKDNTVQVCDPIDGKKEIDLEYFKNIWETCGSYAVIIK